VTVRDRTGMVEARAEPAKSVARPPSGQNRTSWDMATRCDVTLRNFDAKRRR